MSIFECQRNKKKKKRNNFVFFLTSRLPSGLQDHNIQLVLDAE